VTEPQDELAEVTVTVNGESVTREVPVRRLLSDFLRHDLGLTGTHVGCEHGVCGCCTVIMDGAAVRSCLLLAVQSAGSEVRTIEGLSSPEEPMHPVQQAFQDEHALQCGFCTPGFVMAISNLLENGGARDLGDDEDRIREAISGNLCRCTGYQNIVGAVRRAAATMAANGDRA
jgi:carbon-monoxide dehydrogenase small subunit